MVLCKHRMYCQDRKAIRKLDILFSCEGQDGVGTPKEPGHCIFVHYMHDCGARTGTRYPEYLQGAVTGNTKEASGQRTTALLQGGLAISAAGGQIPP